MLLAQQWKLLINLNYNAMKKISIFTLIVVLVFSCSGCGKGPVGTETGRTQSGLEQKVEEESMLELNQRQIEICEAVGLPTQLDELEPHQQKSVMRIEGLLQYLDDKYNKTFKYAGYVADGILEDEHLVAYSEDMNIYKTTTLYVNEDGTFEDDYVQIYVAAEIESELNLYAMQNWKAKAKAFVSDCDTETEDITTVSLDTLGDTCAFFTIVLEAPATQEDVEKYSNDLISWAKGYGLYGTVETYVVETDDFDDTTIENYENIKVNAGVDFAFRTDF